MKKTKSRTCYGCKAICSPRLGGCAFGFKTTSDKIPGSVVMIKNRRPAEPCYRTTTQTQYLRVLETMDEAVMA